MALRIYLALIQRDKKTLLGVRVNAIVEIDVRPSGLLFRFKLGLEYAKNARQSLLAVKHVVNWIVVRAWWELEWAQVALSLEFRTCSPEKQCAKWVAFVNAVH
ncbi:protein of unknown function [Streptomyces sp. KY75]|nr:protein of unknown function [Streptomyces sp. KY75]CAD5986978.1 protein of unknown function [Streptomyces sp. KY70]